MVNELSLQNLVVVLICVFLLACIVIFHLFLRLQKAEEEKNSELREQNHILKSLADIYYSMHLIDLTDDTVVPYHAEGSVRRIVNKPVGAIEMMRQVIAATAKAQYQEETLAFTELTTVADRMQNKKIITHEFQGNESGWVEAAFIAVDVDASGRPTKVIFATRNINDEKQREAQLIYTSNTDELTGLMNRRAYEEAVTSLEENGMGDDFIYLSVDLNGLKLVNDTKGHTAGDELLIGASKCLKHCLGDYGTIYRVGGDEFIAFIHADQEEFRKIKESIVAETTAWKGRFVDCLSVAFGYVSKKEASGLSIHEMAMLADKRMYIAKSAHYSQEGMDRRGRVSGEDINC